MFLPIAEIAPRCTVLAHAAAATVSPKTSHLCATKGHIKDPAKCQSTDFPYVGVSEIDPGASVDPETAHSSYDLSIMLSLVLASP